VEKGWETKLAGRQIFHPFLFLYFFHCLKNDAATAEVGEDTGHGAATKITAVSAVKILCCLFTNTENNNSSKYGN